MVAAVLGATASVGPLAVTAHADSWPVVDVWFPVQLPASFSDTWGAARGGGRTHEGVDILAEQMHEVYAAQSGSIIKAEGEDCAPGATCESFYLAVAGDDGRGYFYVHLNDDTPGRPNGCDHRGGVEGAFSPRLVDVLRAQGTLEGARVERGEHIGYIGSGGNAACMVDHLHFEIWNDHDWGSSGKINPYPSVQAAYDAGRAWGEDGAPGSPDPHDRIAGADRIRTSVALSRSAYASAPAVVIAPADTYQEALLAAPLAANLDAPVLLAWADNLPERRALEAEVADEVQRLGAGYVVLVGNEDRLSPAIERQLTRDAGVQPDHIRRISAPDAYALSRKVANEVLAPYGIYGGVSISAASTDAGADDGHQVTAADEDGHDVAAADEPATTEPQEVPVLLALGEHEVEGRGWPDALAASVLASRQRIPVLLTRPGALPAATREVLGRDGIGEVRIVGGTAAISADVEQEVRDLGRATRRLAGVNRFETSLAVADEVVAHGGDRSEVYVATGLDFPDALSSGAAIASRGFVLVLVDGHDPEQGTGVYDWLRGHGDEVLSLHAVGGEAVVTDAVMFEAATSANERR